MSNDPLIKNCDSVEEALNFIAQHQHKYQSASQTPLQGGRVRATLSGRKPDKDPDLIPLWEQT